MSENKPIYVMDKWRNPRPRDECVSLLVVIPNGVLERVDGVSATVMEGWFMYIKFVWPSVLTNMTKVTDAVLQGWAYIEV